MMPALMYHDVVSEGTEDSSGFPGSDAALYKVSPRQFDEHIRAIVVRIQPAHAVITLDDGGITALTAADTLERHGLRGYFLVTANYIGTPGFLGGSGIRDLHARGHFIGSHSCSHPLRMGHCSWPRLIDEWRRSRDILCAIVGEDIGAASVPGGDYSPAVGHAAAAAGFTLLFTSEPTVAVQRVSALEVRGRFTISRRTTATTAAALAAGERLACAHQALLWSAKKIGKRLGGERYLQVRRLLLGHEAEMRWGDDRRG